MQYFHIVAKNSKIIISLIENTRNLILLIIACYFFTFSQISPTLAQGNQDYDIKYKSVTEDSLFTIIKNSLVNKDKNLFSKEGLISLGIDINSLALDYETFNAILDGQSKYVQDYHVQIKENKILLSKNSNEARYFIKYSTSFYVNLFRFKIDEVWESGLMRRVNGSWIIFQQHTSVPITNDIWPVYLAKKSIISEPLHLFSKSELSEDFDLFTLALEQAHGRLYKFNSSENYKKLNDSIKDRIINSMTELDFYKLICPVIVSIKCGHTRISLSKHTNNYLNNQRIFFPYKLKFIKGRAFVLNTLNDNTIVEGSEIVSINNRKMSEIVSYLFKMIGSDGGITTAKYKKLEERFHEYYCKFIEQTNEFLISYIPYGSKNIKAITSEAILNSTWWNKIKSLCPPTEELLKLTINDDSDIAILIIRKFVSQEINKSYKSFRHFADSAFNVIHKKNIEHLVIDLRGNGGGDIAHELLAYLINRPVNYLRITDTPNTRYSFLEHTDKGLFFNEVHVNLWSKYRNIEGRYELPGSSNMSINPSPLVYDGDVYVLIDGNTFSGASNIAGILQDQHRATFFGEETGGCIYGSNSDDYLVLTLPSTQIRVTIPIRNGVNNISAIDNLNRGVIPDYEITNSITDILEKNDSELGYVINHITKGK